MKKKVITSEGMNILDVVLFLEGSIEGLPAFLERNPHINPNGIINAGTEVVVDTDNQERPEIVNYFQSRDVRVNTGDIEIPSPPSGLTAVPTPSEIGSITLNWSDNSQGLYGFEIWRKKKGALDFLIVHESEVAETTWQNDSLDHGTTYEYQVRVKGFAGAVEFSNIAEATTPGADLEIRNTNSSKLVATGTNFVWDHRAGISYLFALSGKSQINSISACDAGVSGVIDLTSNDWLNLVYICFKNALNPDLRLGSWVNQTGVTLDVENAFYESSDFERMLAEIERVNDFDTVIANRTFNAGIVLVDLDGNPTLQGRIDALTALGWTIKIVNYKLLSATIGERTYVDFTGRVTANSGAELWFCNGKRVVGSVQLENGDIMELYHSDLDSVSYINVSTMSIVNYDPSIILLSSNIHLDLVNNNSLKYDSINELIQIVFDYLEDGTITANGLKLNMINCFEDVSVFNHALNGAVSEYGIEIIIPQAVLYQPIGEREVIPSWKQELAKDEEDLAIQNAVIGSKKILNTGKYYDIETAFKFSQRKINITANEDNTWYLYLGDNRRVLNELSIIHPNAQNPHTRSSILVYTENNLPYDPSLVKYWRMCWVSTTQKALDKILESENIEVLTMASNYGFNYVVDEDGNKIDTIDLSKASGSIKELYLGGNGGLSSDVKTVTGLVGKSSLVKFSGGLRMPAPTTFNHVDFTGCSSLETLSYIPRANLKGCTSLKSITAMKFAGQRYGWLNIEDCTSLESVGISNSAAFVNNWLGVDYSNSFRINSSKFISLDLYALHNTTNQQIAFMKPFSPDLVRFFICSTGFQNGLEGLDFSVINGNNNVYINFTGCILSGEDKKNYGILNSEMLLIVDQLSVIPNNGGVITCLFQGSPWDSSKRYMTQATVDKIMTLDSLPNFNVTVNNYNII
ncbi:fibronectin type III domain-containing protein [Flammeovirga sp. SJP92]|uniref:fibronectin type III domain-containing protein n=1 Tax=Flammeovirga sp. SJP92 TaxID=1775430 RepID=UPI000786C0E3|nr:fibronectin type III domain-containing protein [Flammeovirga sp. SJP92]KXX70795.1 hypothetical protein AVL50_07090 [Flammeovirga sp. SJP92]